MEGYYLYAVIPPVLGFIDDLTNWYVRRARRRFWRSRGDDEADKLAAFATMHEVLVTFATVLAPVLPFVTEEIHQALVVAPSADGSPPASIHHADYPVADPALIDVDLELAMESVRAVTRLSHALRKQHGVKVRQPLRSVTVLTRSSEVEQAVRSHIELIQRRDQRPRCRGESRRVEPGGPVGQTRLPNPRDPGSAPWSGRWPPS